MKSIVTVSFELPDANAQNALDAVSACLSFCDIDLYHEGANYEVLEVSVVDE